MALVGVMDKLIRIMRPAADLQPDLDYKPLNEEDSAVSYRKKVFMVSVPAFFDLLATGFCCMGMLYIPASIWQMLKGGSIIFCGILSVTFLRRKLYVFHWCGLLL